MINPLKTATLERKLPILAVEQGCILSKDANITVAFEVTLPELFTVSSQEYEALHGVWLKAVKVLSAEGIKTNVTLIFTANQALLAARAGASYVSPFLGRLDDISTDGLPLIRQIVEMFEVAGIDTQIICASVRHPIHVTECALAGADIATVPYKVLEQMTKHPLTDAGIEKFQKDYKAVFGDK
mgnify:CR=1 FL=1